MTPRSIGQAVRGRIIHYDASAGTGLIATARRQYVFEIRHWTSEIAPAQNQPVCFRAAGLRAHAVSVVPWADRVRHGLDRFAAAIARLFRKA